jgi:hypothetical protein
MHAFFGLGNQAHTAYWYVSWHYASGLALYALTGSLLSIVAQKVLNRSALKRKMRAPGAVRELSASNGR